jgi:hypothetical protein
MSRRPRLETSRQDAGSQVPIRNQRLSTKSSGSELEVTETETGNIEQQRQRAHTRTILSSQSLEL